MSLFGRLPIRQKVMLAILAGSVTTVGVGGVSLVTYEAATYRHQALNTSRSLSSVVAANSTGALTFHDADTAQQVLTNLGDNPSVYSARLYDFSGEPLATFRRDPNGDAPPERPSTTGHRFESDRLILVTPVMLHGDRVGTLYFSFDLARERGRLWAYVGAVALAMAVLGAIAVFVSYGLQRFVSAPILDLADLAKHITENNDFSVRAQGGGDDEIGALTNAFNLMLKAIQTREMDLEQSRQNLVLAQAGGRIGSFNWFERTGRFECSDEFLALFGFTRDTWGGTRDEIRRLIHPDDLARNAEAIRMALAGDGNVTVEYRLLWPDGTIRWMVTRARIHKTPDGSMDRMSGVALEITERKQFEARLVEQAEALWRSNRELEQFAYVSSHDLQEPLRKVASYAELLASKYRSQLGEEADRYIENITDGVGRMRDLIHDLLAYSRLTRQELPMEAVPMSEVVTQILSDLEPSIQEQRAEVRVTTALPTVQARRSQMQQLLQNLVANALKFHAERRPVVEIGHERRGTDDVFFVRDNGIGIEEIYSEQIFKVFQRLHPRGHFPGTGIGLAICKKIVEQHGGRIWLKSEVDKGTTFFFSIPEVKPDADALAARPGGAGAAV